MNITRTMCQIGKQLTAVGCVALGLAWTTSIAQAAITISTVNAFDGSTLGSTVLTFDAISPVPSILSIVTPDVTVSFLPDAKVVNGGVSGQYAPPWNFTTSAPDATNYITSGSYGSVSNASVTFAFANAQNYIGLLWGSVDDYNTLAFYKNADLINPVFTVTGVQVNNPANGDQGVNGTRYVNITSDIAFDRVVATSSQYAFEFDNVAYLPSTLGGGLEVPEPASLAIWGLGVLGLATIRARRKKPLLG